MSASTKTPSRRKTGRLGSKCQRPTNREKKGKAGRAAEKAPGVIRYSASFTKRYSRASGPGSRLRVQAQIAKSGENSRGILPVIRTPILVTMPAVPAAVEIMSAKDGVESYYASLTDDGKMLAIWTKEDDEAGRTKPRLDTPSVSSVVYTCRQGHNLSPFATVGDSHRKAKRHRPVRFF